MVMRAHCNSRLFQLQNLVLIVYTHTPELVHKAFSTYVVHLKEKTGQASQLFVLEHYENVTHII